MWWDAQAFLFAEAFLLPTAACFRALGGTNVLWVAQHPHCPRVGSSAMKTHDDPVTQRLFRSSQYSLPGTGHT